MKFCKDCKFKKIGLIPFCASENISIPNPTLGFRNLLLEHSFDKNTDGNCPDYKRKWYLVWVKP